MDTDYKKEFFAQQGDFLTIEKAPTVEPSDISEKEFNEMWLVMFPNGMDYDPDQFPTRFEFDVLTCKFFACLKRNGHA